MAPTTIREFQGGVSMKAFLITAALILTTAPAMARIAICPITGRPYDTTTGLNVDEPGTSNYIAPEDRNYGTRRRSSRRTWTMFR